MNLGTRNKNWLNIRYSDRNNWKGQTGEEKGFCTFDTVEHGLRAALVIMLKYLKRGVNTVEKIINVWAPTNENDTALYIRNVCTWTGMKPEDPISRANLGKLVAAMARMETSNIVTDAMLAEAWREIENKGGAI
jgi:hypothetical protein